MALTDREKYALKEKYKESRRELWGFRRRKRKLPTEQVVNPEAEPVQDSRVGVSVLRRAEEPAAPMDPQEPAANETVPAANETISEFEASPEKPIITLEPIEEPEAVGFAEEAVSPYPETRTRSSARPSDVEHEEIRRQLQEKIKEQRRATWAGERSTPKLTTPPKRKAEKAEREFWDEPPPRESGISLGVALLIVLGCVGVVVIGVLLGYLLTAF